MVAALVDVEMVQAVGLLLLLLAILWAVVGNRVIRVLAFPVLFIGFAIPIWFPLSPLLQNLTADAVFGAIRFFSVPAFRQENMIMLPAGTLSVEEACSGLRYLLAALTLGTLYAYMNYSSIRARLMVVLISAGAAIFANIIRVFIVVYLAYTTEMKHPLVADHLSLGWYLFGGLVVILLFIDARLNRVVSNAASDTSDVLHEVTPVLSEVRPTHYFIFVTAVCFMASVAPVVVYQLSQQSSDGVGTVAAELPSEAGSWLRTEAMDDSWAPVYHGAINQQQSYIKNEDEVIFYLGYYAVQNRVRS